MSARVLVVDDVPANLRLLQARLAAEYFDVITATNGDEALGICERGECDVVLLDVMMPGVSGFEVCRHLKSSTSTHHIPVVMVTALDQQSDRIKGLEAGADDFLTKPVSELALIARVRSLARLKQLTDELRVRAVSIPAPGMRLLNGKPPPDAGHDGHILVVDDCAASSAQITAMLACDHRCTTQPDPTAALFHAAEENYDVFIISLALSNFDALRLCSQLRSLERTRSIPILAISSLDDNTRLLRGLEIGVNDYLVPPVDKNELLARVRTQVRNRRYIEKLRDDVQKSLELAITDALTGLHNRRYMERHIGGLVEQASSLGKPLAVLMLDVDHFKAINDSYGHAAGDEVLREFALRIRRSIRGLDLACRYGGEEFLVVMPETDLSAAALAAERLRRRIASDPFPIQRGERAMEVTISVGIAALAEGEDPASVLKRADEALYRAKRDGRNRVVPAAA
jgi:two-component system cell cycle response regulator